MTRKETMDKESFADAFSKLPLEDMRDVMNELQNIHADAVRRKRKELTDELNRLGQAEARHKGSSKGSSVEPKYRDPATGATWAGRGMVPNWLKAYEAKGKKRTQFEIK